ncbi:hypothetical protein J7E71_09715 [Mesobacillus foraminis]|uniref:hypothetical protein n=1 Tax=Mesobacillus foraminis TaxID=279826 RepID=UPI001BE5AD43|nr:hypothetical protein [Mesobacillus foraminis]MBT2756230.1 hypothetical protein [Mesobacillus foraminis]
MERIKVAGARIKGVKSASSKSEGQAIIVYHRRSILVDMTADLSLAAFLEEIPHRGKSIMIQ